MKIIKITPILLLALPLIVTAHVKWFVEYDTTKKPEPIFSILNSPDVVGLFILSLCVMMLTSLLDRRWRSPVDIQKWQETIMTLEKSAPAVIRYGTSLFFLLLSVLFPYIMLTPELVTDNPALRYVHILVALTAFHRRISFIAGLGILFLYSYAVQLYGTFHMMDYLVFVGVASHLIMQSLRGSSQQGGEIELLRLTLCYSFLWGAIEKFMQPALFDELLRGHTYLTMGLSHKFFILSAGFVEFCLAWHMLTGKLAGYAAQLGLGFLVISAIIPFGHVDFIGHFLFIVPLIAIIFTPRQNHMFRTVYGNTIAFVISLFALFLLAYLSYYILHYQLHPNLFVAQLNFCDLPKG